MKFGKFFITGCAFLFASTAFAGLSRSLPVEVVLNGDGSGSALGDMVTARFADNDVEYIGCGIRTFQAPGGSTSQFGFCQAGDADGVRAFCNTDNAEVLSAMHAVNAYSYITFSFDRSGRCVRIGNSSQSQYIPESAEGKKKEI